MDFGNMVFGGQLNDSITAGFKMAQMADQMRMAEHKMNQDYELTKLLKEEQALTLRAKREQMDEALRFRKKFDEFTKPQTMTGQVPPGELGTDPVGPIDTMTVQGPSPLQRILGNDMGAIVGAMGPEGSKGILQEMVKQQAGGKTLEQLLAEKVRNREMSLEDAIKLKTSGKTPNEIELTQRALDGDEEAKRTLDELYKNKRSLIDIRIPPYTSAPGVPPGYVLNRKTGQYEWKGEGPAPGMDPVTVADYSGMKKGLEQQEKSYTSMGQFVGNINGQINKVEGMMNDVIKRVGVRALDVPIRELKTRFVGSGHERVLESYLMEISREIGKLSTGSQASIAELSVEAQKKWDKIHDPNLSLKDLSIVLNATRDQANIRKESAFDAIAETKSRIRGLGKSSPTPEAKPSAGRPLPKF